MHRYILKAANIDYMAAFFGTDKEQAANEIKEATRAAELAKIIYDRSFKALEYTTTRGQRRILHHSTRHGVLFQLSYIDPDGVPAMHENYIQTSPDHVDEAIYNFDSLVNHFIGESNENDLILKIL